MNTHKVYKQTQRQTDVHNEYKTKKTVNMFTLMQA